MLILWVVGLSQNLQLLLAVVVACQATGFSHGKRYQEGWCTAEIVRKQKAPHLLHLPSLPSSHAIFLSLGDQVADAGD